MDYPHVQAAFINAIAEEGTKAEAIEWLQKQWNETCALQKALRFCADLANEEHANSRVGTGAEVALRHISRKAREHLSE